jgi:hypothetical protein
VDEVGTDFSPQKEEGEWEEEEDEEEEEEEEEGKEMKQYATSGIGVMPVYKTKPV